jgi:hypothetical protein
MKATLLPLKGKYYGTEIQVKFQDAGEAQEIRLWDSTGFEPSTRQLEKHGYTQVQWDNNEEVNDGHGGLINIKLLDIVTDSHFESKITYQRALELVEKINSHPAARVKQSNELHVWAVVKIEKHYVPLKILKEEAIQNSYKYFEKATECHDECKIHNTATSAGETNKP